MSHSAILITGIAGFLGEYISRYFSTKGWGILGLDQNVADQKVLKRLNIESFHRIDLPSKELETLINSKQPAGIIHAAGPASVAWSMENPYEDFRNSVDAFFQLLDCVRRFSPGTRVIFLSSAAVYGNPERIPVGESSSLNPISPYGFHKKICELLALEFHLIYSVPICSTRIFSAFGEGLRKQVLWDICRKASNNKEVILHGTGEETRDFIHAIDIARAICLIFEKGKFEGETYNLAGGRQTSIRDVANALLREIDPNISIRFTGEIRPGDPTHWEADMSRLNELGFRPEMEISEGIKAYAKWFISKCYNLTAKKI